MESIDKFIYINEFPEESIFGDGGGFGRGDRYGDERGNCYGYDIGNGAASGDGDKYGYGYGGGAGNSGGDTFACGGGSLGHRNGDGHDKYIKFFNGEKIYQINGICIIIESVHSNYAKGKILNEDFTLTECYIAKCGNYFAHGTTLSEAFNDAQQKCSQHVSIEERIEIFNNRYPSDTEKIDGKELFKWHNILTGNFLSNQKQFCKNNNLDIENRYTIPEFISITRNAFKGEIIDKLILKRYEKKERRNKSLNNKYNKTKIMENKKTAKEIIADLIDKHLISGEEAITILDEINKCLQYYPITYSELYSPTISGTTMNLNTETNKKD